ncbi:carcinoembryonic antigen-related cell adhesion molecule 1-like isoform X2 [Ursus maritimus]|uniref:Carcinoembryonic antigen-related cell adhesion molecule 1-like isoform X2 n=1 Tax=Ursus maritimus TaxID=29073 RepID=A0A8M1G303_URSMA|nr:carcinoembryonic antigen-related cell adhesion molecule 1-like isoform X2 [Ursus maritimus]
METEAISLLPSPPLPGSADPPWAQERERRHHPHIMGSQPGWASAEAAFLGHSAQREAGSQTFKTRQQYPQCFWSRSSSHRGRDRAGSRHHGAPLGPSPTRTCPPGRSSCWQRVTLNDTGYYTLQIVRRDTQVEQGTGQIRVFLELPKPNITSNNSDPVENEDSVVLTCEPQTQSTSYLWSVNRKSLPASARLELSLDNRTLTIHRVTRNDTGPLQCETRNPVSAGRSDPFTLNVL